MNELIEKYKSILLQVGIIEIKFYSDTNFIYLLGVKNECLASVEFNNAENNIEKAIRDLYNIALNKRLIQSESIKKKKT